MSARRMPSEEQYADPLRALAAAVVQQAMEDAIRPVETKATHVARRNNEARLKARTWLRGGPELEHWTQAAGVEPQWLIDWWSRQQADLMEDAA